MLESGSGWLSTGTASGLHAVITNPGNPVRQLDMREIGAIHVGWITNWSQVGGPDAPITVLSREDGSSTRGVFENAVLSGEEPQLADRVTYPGGGNPEMAAAIALRQPHPRPGDAGRNSLGQTIDRLGGQRLSDISFERRAHGERAPSVCNTDINGRTINRRVALWVRKWPAAPAMRSGPGA